jgi:hypothetical protein
MEEEEEGSSSSGVACCGGGGRRRDTSRHVDATDVPKEGLPREVATRSSRYKHRVAEGSQTKRWISSKTGPRLRVVVVAVSLLLLSKTTVAGLMVATKEG